MIIFNLILTIILAVIVHCVILPYFPINGVVANISIAVFTSIALLLKKPYGSIVGLSIGFLEDVLFGPIVGINALIYFLLGYILDNVEGRINRDNILIPIAASMAATVLYNFLYYIVVFFIGSNVSFIYYIKTQLWIEVIYNAVIIIPVYMLLSKIFEAPSVMFVRD